MCIYLFIFFQAHELHTRHTAEAMKAEKWQFEYKNLYDKYDALLKEKEVSCCSSPAHLENVVWISTFRLLRLSPGRYCAADSHLICRFQKSLRSDNDPCHIKIDVLFYENEYPILIGL